MDKIDITKNELYIKRIINVWRSEITDAKDKPIYVNSRHSDALVYIVDGSCTYSFEDGREFTVNTGDVLYLAKSDVYKMNVNVNRHRYIYTDFEFESDEKRKSDYYTSVVSGENLFVKLLSSHKTGFAECTAVLYMIYANILKAEKDVRLSRFDISKTLEYIEKNFANPLIGVDALAEMSGVSDVYFRKLFKMKTGMSPSQYIILKRVEYSKKLLVHSFMTLEKCAFESGFSSLQYFCRAFKKVTGMTPGEYRKAKNKV